MKARSLDVFKYIRVLIAATAMRDWSHIQGTGYSGFCVVTAQYPGISAIHVNVLIWPGKRANQLV